MGPCVEVLPDAHVHMRISIVSMTQGIVATPMLVVLTALEFVCIGTEGPGLLQLRMG